MTPNYRYSMAKKTLPAKLCHVKEMTITDRSGVTSDSLRSLAGDSEFVFQKRRYSSDRNRPPGYSGSDGKFKIKLIVYLVLLMRLGLLLRLLEL